MDYGFDLLGQWVSYLEIAAMLSGVAGVWLTLKQNIWCFPVGMINVGLYAFLFFTPSVRLYADAFLQCIYFALLIYGWFKWLRPESQTSKKIKPSKCSGKILIRISGLLLLAAVLCGWFLDTFTDAALPWMDSTLSSMSLGAQWMIAKKKIENWILWIIVDILYIPLYLAKDLPLTAILYFIFLLLAFRGWKEWKHSINLQQNE